MFNSTFLTEDYVTRMGKNLLWIGILSLIFGFLALAAPVFSTATIVYIVGFSLLMAGAMAMYQVFATCEGAWMRILYFLVSILYFWVGYSFLFNFLQGAIVIFYALGFMFLFEGITDFIESKQSANRGWMIFNGILSCILAIWVLFYAFNDNGAAALLFLPYFVGISLIFKGIALLSLHYYMDKNKADLSGSGSKQANSMSS